MENEEKTEIVFMTSIPVKYDLINDPDRRGKMLKKIYKNLQRFKTPEALRDRMIQDAQDIKLKFEPMVQQWWTMIRQIEFLDKFIDGEIEGKITTDIKQESDVDLGGDSNGKEAKI